MAETKPPRNNAHCTIPDDPEQSTYRFIIVAAKRARQLRGGARPVLQVGLAARTIAIAILAVAFLSGIAGVPLALAGFVVLVMAWPLLGVSGTALAALLAPAEKGEALGLFNASSSLAGAVGAFLGGWATETVGYGTVCLVGAVVVGLAALCSGGGNARPPASD